MALLIEYLMGRESRKFRDTRVLRFALNGAFANKMQN